MAFPSPVPVPSSQPPVYRAGTLTYDKTALYRLFFWLLVGDLAYTLVGQLEIRVFPVFLKQHGASDKIIALIAGTIPSFMRLFLNPVVNYRSDRKRSPRGRRIPYLLWAGPCSVFFLALVPFAPDIVGWLGWTNGFSGLLAKMPLAPVVLVFAGMAILYETFQLIFSPAYFCLLRDVVPLTHLGRFMSLFRMMGALATFVFNYWLFGLTDRHIKYLFGGVALAGMIGYLAMSLSVKEGEYPPVVEKNWPRRGLARLAIFRVCFNFTAESFTLPLYWWIYVTRLFIYAAQAASAAFLIFFGQQELGLTLADTDSTLAAWPALLGGILAFPIGWLLDRRGPIPVLTVALAAMTAGCLGSFFFVSGNATFIAVSLFTGATMWILILVQLVLAQQLFNPARMGQISSANTLVQSVAIGLIIIPATGWFLDLMKGSVFRLPLPLVGVLSIGPYRFVYLILAVLYSFSLLGIVRVRHHWRLRGGPDHYVPPPIEPEWEGEGPRT